MPCQCSDICISRGFWTCDSSWSEHAFTFGNCQNEKKFSFLNAFDRSAYSRDTIRAGDFPGLPFHH